ncbi:hypothetical protein K523DRAFT_369589 [Schizophyllum commune Tattone D]|nr:hypothetical protein K523DRAFT_369589 [Schizophyllum commune Tattone D]
MPRRFAVFDLFTSKSHKINRIIEAKVAQLPPSTYPAGYHPCTASNCDYANPPSSTAGIFGCLGAPEDAFTCTGCYHVSEKQALKNRERLEGKLMRKARDARTEVWEEQMRNWFWEFEAMEREREVARAAAKMERPRAPTPNQTRASPPPTSRTRGPRARSPAICEDRSAGHSSRTSPAQSSRASPAHSTRRSPEHSSRRSPTSGQSSGTRNWVVHNA